MTEEEYRGLPLNSSSSLKDFSVDRRKYHKKYILGEDIREQDNQATNMGRLVETLLMEEDRFDDLFFMSTCVKVPGGMLGDFINRLSILVGEATRDGVLTRDFDELAMKAYEAVGFKIKFASVLAKLEDPENQLYYDECLNVNFLKKTLVSAQDVENAEQIVRNLRNNIFTRDIVNLETSRGIEVINQMKISDFSIFGLDLKAMLDKVIINHDAKLIIPIDLKCTWAVEKFYKEYYLYRRAYIQAYIYHKACESLTLDPESPYYNYNVKNLKFLVCDSINYYDPLIYTLTDDDMLEAQNGFEYKGTKYPGVKDIIHDLKWAMENDIWGISRTNYENEGRLNIKA